jgi:hypothetical protein
MRSSSAQTRRIHVYKCPRTSIHTYFASRVHVELVTTFVCGLSMQKKSTLA